MQEKIGGDERTLLADSEDGMAAEDEIVDFVVDDYSLNRLDLDDSRERIETEDGSLLPAETWKYLGEQSLPSVSPTTQPYLEAAKAPQGWFAGVDNIVHRVWMSVGERECLRDDVLLVAGMLKSGERQLSEEAGFVTTVVHKDGVHNDQYLDFMAQETRLGELTPQIIGWLEEGLEVCHET